MKFAKRLSLVVALGLVVVIIHTRDAGGDEPAPGRVKIFLLAGQSNMEGQGVVDLDHPRYYNGGRGILERVM